MSHEIRQGPSQEVTKEGKSMSRREFLKNIAVLGGLAALSTAIKAFPSFAVEYVGMEGEKRLAQICNELIRRRESLRQYCVLGVEPLGERDQKYALISQNASSEPGKYRLAFSEGEVPTFCMINSEGVCDFSNLGADFGEGIIENNADIGFFSPDDFKQLSETFPPEALTNTERKNILVFGDSWTRWNGFEASFPAFLQSLCDLSGKPVKIIDSSATSIGVTDFIYHYYRLKDQYEPSQVLFTYHPNSDARFDAVRANMDYDIQIASIGRVGGLQVPRPIMNSATNLLRRCESSNLDFFTTVKAMVKNLVRGSASDALISDDEIKMYNDQATKFVEAVQNDGVNMHVLALPPYDIGQLDKIRYSEILNKILVNYEEHGVDCIDSVDAFRSNDFDEYSHPTFIGSLKLAIIAYSHIFNEWPTEAVIENVIALHKKRRQILNNVRRKVMSSI